jgi:hypothetical protein
VKLLIQARSLRGGRHLHETTDESYILPVFAGCKARRRYSPDMSPTFFETALHTRLRLHRSAEGIADRVTGRIPFFRTIRLTGDCASLLVLFMIWVTPRSDTMVNER